MNLFSNYNNTSLLKVAKKTLEELIYIDLELHNRISKTRKSSIYDDIIYSLSHLLTSVYFSDINIFSKYALWIYELICNQVQDVDRDEIAKYMITLYQLMYNTIEIEFKDDLTEEELAKCKEYLLKAIDITKDPLTQMDFSKSFFEGDFSDIRKEYLEALISNNTNKAHEIIDIARKNKIPLINIYEEILSKAMYEIGELWHKNIITIDKEHYATSVTQTIMSKFYDEIFSTPRKNLIFLSCAVGSDLHEIGIRIISDLFEYNGWDTYYLGSAITKDSILNAIEEYTPDLIGLSVTLAPYLTECKEIIEIIKEKHPNLKIAVGGQAFESTYKIWEIWNIDNYSTSADDLLNWAKGEFYK